MLMNTGIEFEHFERSCFSISALSLHDINVVVVVPSVVLTSQVLVHTAGTLPVHWSPSHRTASGSKVPVVLSQ